MEANKDLTQESAEILTVRGTAPVENGIKFSQTMMCYRTAKVDCF